jgi:Mrp family chromosome partitioning ATPase
LPVLATLGDLNDMDPKQQMSSALRGWSLIFGRTCQAAGDTFICGFVSSRPGEGCTTWIKRLAEAARQRGYRVVAFSTNPTSSPVPGPITTDAIAANPIPALRNGADWLREGLLQLEKSPTQFVEFSPPCDWKWNCEQVEQWKAALREYSGRARTVVLVELPPAQLPESVLLADTVPRAIWLASSGLPRRSESREQLETLLSARCNLVGAVLNREPGGILRNGQSR